MYTPSKVTIGIALEREAEPDDRLPFDHREIRGQREELTI